MKTVKFDSLADEQIVKLLISNDEGLICYLFYDKCKPMFAYIVKEVFEYQVDLNELVSEFYIYLKENNWQKVCGFTFRSKFTTWLSVVAVRFFIKKKKEMIDLYHENAPLNKELTTLSVMPYDVLSDKMDLYMALNKLRSPRDKFVIITLEIEGRPVEEVASQLNVTVANLYNIRKRAHTRLYNILKEYKYAN